MQATELGYRIKQFMQQRGMTQSQLAEKARVSANYISKIEQGIVNPPIRTLARIASALGVTIDDLRGR